MRIRFAVGSIGTNNHGTQIIGAWNKETVRGPKLRRVKLSVHNPSTGYRYIYYFPDGSWWYLDVTFDRRPKVERGEG